jgi:hypothetical protein
MCRDYCVPIIPEDTEDKLGPIHFWQILILILTIATSRKWPRMLSHSHSVRAVLFLMTSRVVAHAAPTVLRSCFVNVGTSVLARTKAMCTSSSLVQFPRKHLSHPTFRLGSPKMVSSFARVATSKDDVEMPGSIDRLSVEVLCNEGRLVTLKAGIEGEGTQLQGCEVQFENGCSGVVLYQRTPLLFALADQHSQSTADTATKLSFGSNANINVKSNITMAVGNELVGRVVNFKGVPLDGKELTAQATRAIFSPPTLQSDLATISKPLHTGFTAIDALTPIGRGQNMLLIGNEILGRLEIVIDTIVTSGREGVKCVYVSTDGKHNDVVQRLQALGAMKHTTVVAADSINPDCSGLGECVMAAAAGCSIAEHWRKEGQDTLVIVNNIEAHRCFWDFTDRVLIQVTPKIDHRQGRSIGASQGAQRR